MDFDRHVFTHVIVGKVQPALRATDRADLNDARRQHDCYVRMLKELGVEVIEVEIPGSIPESLQLEETALVCHGIALLAPPSQFVTAEKINIVKKVLTDLGQEISEVTDKDAKIRFSDVLFTGREIFVGMTQNTNEAGAKFIAKTFPEYPTIPLKTSKDAKPFKNYITIGGKDIICVGTGKESQALVRRMERKANFTYSTLTVPEDEAANCLYINSTLVHRAIEEIPESFKVFCEKIDYSRRSICFSELAKGTTGLTSCCLLVGENLGYLRTNFTLEDRCREFRRMLDRKFAV